MSVKVDLKQLKQLQKDFDKLADSADEIIQRCAKELAARLLAKVIKRTPVDSGTLRRAWTIENKDFKVRQVGSIYEIEVINSTEYAPYVEFGHRTASKRGWVPGRFMLTISEEEIRQNAPAIVESKIAKWLTGAMK